MEEESPRKNLPIRALGVAPTSHSRTPPNPHDGFNFFICHSHFPLSAYPNRHCCAALAPPWLPVRRSRFAAPRRPLAYPPLALPWSRGWSPSPRRVLPLLESLHAPPLAGDPGAVGCAPDRPRRGAAAPLARGRRWWCQGKRRRARRAPSRLCLASRALAALAAPLSSPPQSSPLAWPRPSFRAATE